MIDDEELIQRAKIKFSESSDEVVTNAFITEATDHTKIVVLRNDTSVLANYQVLDNDDLLRLDQNQK